MGTLRVFSGAGVFVPSAEGIGHLANANLNVGEPPGAIVHRDRQVAVVIARFGMPWLNTRLVLVDAETLGTGTAVVQLPGWERRKLVDALARTGFAVDTHRRAFSMGSNI